MLCFRASCTISSMRVSCRPLAMAMRSMGRCASRASFTAWIPVSLSMRETVYRQQFTVDSRRPLHGICRVVAPAALSQRRAKFQDACAGGFHWHDKWQRGGFVEQEDHPIERTVARTACEREAHGIQHL